MLHLSIAFLFATSLLVSFTGAAPIVLSTSGHCIPDKYTELDDDEISTCSMLYEKFEEALLSQLNIYKLRHVMFPNERAEPLIVDLFFNITVDTLDDKPCFGANNNTKADINTEPYVTERTWTSSVTLSIIDPKDLDFLQPAILTFTNPVARHSYHEEHNRNQASLNLIVDNLSCTPSEKQIEGVLDDITAKVKGYAANADEDPKIDSWDTSYKGYVVQGGKHEFVFVMGPAFSIVIVFLTCAFPLAYKKVYVAQLREKLKNRSAKDGPLYQLFFSVSILTALINVVYYMSELVCFIAILIYQSRRQLLNEYAVTTAGRFVSQIVSIGLSIAVAYNITVWRGILKNGMKTKARNEDKFINKDYTISCFAPRWCRCKYNMIVRTEPDDTLTDQDQLDLYDYISDKICCVICCWKYKCICRPCSWKYAGKNVLEMIAIVNYALFVSFIAWSVVPFITLAFVNPVLTLAIVSFVVVLFILSVILFSLLIFARDKKPFAWRKTLFFSLPTSHTNNYCCNSNRQRPSWCRLSDYCNICLTYSICWEFFYLLILAVLLFIFGTAVILTIYGWIVHKGAGDGSSVSFIIAFVPTIITGGVAWIAKKALFKNKNKDDSHNNDEPRSSSNTDQGGQPSSTTTTVVQPASDTSSAPQNERPGGGSSQATNTQAGDEREIHTTRV